jgi:hypothetical protein
MKRLLIIPIVFAAMLTMAYVVSAGGNGNDSFNQTEPVSYGTPVYLEDGDTYQSCSMDMQLPDGTWTVVPCE